jgi:hypothetical protein
MVFGASFLHAQAAAQQTAQTAGQVFKNVPAMKDLPVDTFMQTMGVFSAALGMSCGDCHQGKDNNWDGFAVDNARKRKTRDMIAMMKKINDDNFAGRQLVTCYSCHRTADAPRNVVNFTELYGFVPPDPNAVVTQSPAAPKPDEVFDKYLAAVGGAQRAAALTSFTATGANMGYGPEGAQDKRPLEIYAKPNQRTVVIKTTNGTSTSVYDGATGWVAAPLRPVNLLQLVGQEAEGLKLEVALMFPSQVKQLAGRWRVGNATTIDDRDQWMVQGNTMGGVILSLYFDQETGLLTRSVRYTESPVGRIPTQIDYSDYRDVNGVKLPHKMLLWWVDGRDSFELTKITPNVNIEAARFSKPAPFSASGAR